MFRGDFNYRQSSACLVKLLCVRSLGLKAWSTNHGNSLPGKTTKGFMKQGPLVNQWVTRKLYAAMYLWAATFLYCTALLSSSVFTASWVISWGRQQ